MYDGHPDVAKEKIETFSKYCKVEDSKHHNGLRALIINDILDNIRKNVLVEALKKAGITKLQLEYKESYKFTNQYIANIPPEQKPLLRTISAVNGVPFKYDIWKNIDGTSPLERLNYSQCHNCLGFGHLSVQCEATKNQYASVAFTKIMAPPKKLDVK